MTERVLWWKIREIYSRKQSRKNPWSTVGEYVALVLMGLLMAWMLVEAF